jgi:hypothetical protein
MANIRLSIVVGAPPGQIYPLFASAQGFSQWWAADARERDGGVDLGFFKRTTNYRLQLASAKSPLHAEWRCVAGPEWNGTRLMFDLTRQDSKTLVRFTHADWKDETDYFVACTTTWGALMFHLKTAAEGKEPGPLFTTDGMAY